MKIIDLKKLDESLINTNFHIIDNFLSHNQIINLQDLFESLDNANRFTSAHIGKGFSKQLQTQIRSDRVFWIDDWSMSNEISEFSLFLCEIQNHFKRSFFLPLKRFESHLAIYDEGAFYKKHYDQHRNSPHRQISVVLYISNFKNDNGGELVIHDNKEIIKIEPIAGRLVIFKSKDVLHEVLETKAKRYSITSWLRDDLIFL